VQYYKLKSTGSDAAYSGITVGSYSYAGSSFANAVADHIVVDKDGTTRVYWYITKDDENDTTTQMDYKTIIDSTNGTAPDDGIVNTAWEGDHQSHRVFATIAITGTDLYSKKDIVTNMPTSDLTTNSNGATTVKSSHNSSVDDTTDYSILHSGDTVVYRLRLWSAGGDASFTGADISDALPQSKSVWSNKNVAITYIKNGNTTINNGDNWSIKYSNGRAYIDWDDNNFSIKLKGTLYIYVTLTMPTGADWTTFSNENASGNYITNILTVKSTVSTVYHRLGDPISGVLQKGVYSTGSISGAKVIDNTVKTTRLYYSNDSSVEGQVTYYFVLYNSGHNIMYLDTVQDVLPKGFTLYESGSTTYTTTLSSDEISALSRNGSPWGSVNWVNDSQIFKISTGNAGNGSQRLSFDLYTPATQDSKYFSYTLDGKKGRNNYDERLDKFYLMPNQGIAVKYVCKTNGYNETEEEATNYITMPIYDFTGTGSVGLSDATFSINNPSDDVVLTSNDDESPTVYTNAKVASLYFKTKGYDDSTQWLASNVVISRGGIKPGIKKTLNSSASVFSNGVSIPWKIEVNNKGQSSMVNYSISDVMMWPYTFIGEVYYQIDVSNSNTTLKGVFLFDFSKEFSSDELLNSSSTCHEISNSTYGAIKVQLSKSGSNAVATIEFEDKAAGIAPNYSGYLTLYTTNKNNTGYVKDFINKAYLTPSQDFDKSDVSHGNYTSYDSQPAVCSEARVPVSYGYATSSSITITDLAHKDNFASGGEYIILESGETEVQYDLMVRNTGGSGGAQPMSSFVLVNNLPGEDDHLTLYEQYDRYSEFFVKFKGGAKTLADLGFVVKIDSGDGSDQVALTEDQYTLQFSEQTNLDFSTIANDINNKVWTGAELNSGDGWYTLAEISSSESLNISDMRSFRVVLNDSATELLKSNAFITVTYDAVAIVPEVAEDEIAESELAWNSFGYYYTAGTSTLYSGSELVGLKTPTIPVITKKLVNSEHDATSALADQEFKFKITKKDGAGAGASTEATVKIAAGESENSISVDDKSWNWEDGATYTVTELDNSGAASTGYASSGKKETFAFFMIGGRTKNSTEFTYDSSEETEIVCKNQRLTWSILLSKKSDYGKSLQGAWFALYTANQASAMTAAEYADAYYADGSDLKEYDVKWQIDGVDTNGNSTKMYLMKDSLKESNESGAATWSDLDEDYYYLLEVRTPNGYAMGDTAGYVVKLDDWSGDLDVMQMVVNYTTYQMPNSGGLGDYKTLAGVGVLAVLGVLFATGLRQRRRLRQR
jgi:hypothetical protein